MPNITKQQAINRWDKLPMVLREAIFSERNADILWGVCETQHLSEDKIYRIATLAGDTIMGFIHPEDLVKEIKEATGIHSDVADLIVKEIDRKIFSPIKSEIDKAYALPLESEAPEEETQAPEIKENIMTDIRRETGGVKITKEVRYAQPAEVEPMRIVGVGEEEKLVIPGTEEESLKVQKLESLEGSAVAEAMADKPVVLHEEEELQSVLGETKKKSLGELFGFLNGKEKPVSKELASAGSVDIGDEGAKNEKDEKIKEPEERVVHYDTGLTTPLNETQIDTDLTQTNTEIEKIEKTESKPRLFFRNIIQAIKPTVKVVDFTEVEEEKKDIPEQKEFFATIDSSKENLEEPKIISEEIKEIEETKEIKEIKKIEEIKEEKPEELPVQTEKKPGFFGKLFKSKKKEEQVVADLTQIDADLTRTDTDKTPEQIQKEEEIKIESIKEKKNLFSKLSGLFVKKTKIETDAELEIKKVEEIK